MKKRIILLSIIVSVVFLLIGCGGEDKKAKDMAVSVSEILKEFSDDPYVASAKYQDSEIILIGKVAKPPSNYDKEYLKNLEDENILFFHEVGDNMYLWGRIQFSDKNEFDEYNKLYGKFVAAKGTVDYTSEADGEIIIGMTGVVPYDDITSLIGETGKGKEKDSGGLFGLSSGLYLLLAIFLVFWVLCSIVILPLSVFALIKYLRSDKK